MNSNQQLPPLFNPNYLRVWSANFMLFFAFYLVTPILPLYLRDTFGADKATIGLVLSGYTITALLIRLFSGYIVDRFDRKSVLILCYGLFALFFMGYYISSSLILFALIRTLHGAPFGITTVASSTMAIDVLHPQRRAEGIGYYGLSNNIAMAIGPSVGLLLYHSVSNYKIIFTLSLVAALIGLAINSSIRCQHRQPILEKKRLSLDRFILLKAWSQGITIICVAFAYGLLSTYVAIYSRDILNITSGTGAFFMLLGGGLIFSRLVCSRSLRKGLIVLNAIAGLIVVAIGYLLFVGWPSIYGYYIAAFVIGMGNGSLFPAIQTMFLNLAPNEQRGTANSTILTCWDIGIGSGIIGGGFVAEHLGGYVQAFWSAFFIGLFGLLFFLLYGRRQFLKNKLR